MYVGSIPVVARGWQPQFEPTIGNFSPAVGKKCKVQQNKEKKTPLIKPPGQIIEVPRPRNPL